MGHTANDVILSYLPLFHAFGFSECMLMSMVSGAKQIVMDVFDPAEALDYVETKAAPSAWL